MLKAGYCRFCGQMANVDDAPDEIKLEELTERVTLACNCEAGTVYRAVAKRRQKAMKNICTLFGEDAAKDRRLPADVVQLLKDAAGLLCDSRMEKVTMNMLGG